MTDHRDEMGRETRGRTLGASLRHSAVKLAEWAGWLDFVDGNIVRHYFDALRLADTGRPLRLADTAPPKFAEFLLTALATARAAEAMIGDLNERFADECQKFGPRRAVRLYWARTLRSLWPLLMRAIARALRRNAVIAA